MIYAYEVKLTTPHGTIWELHFTAPTHEEGKCMVEEIRSMATHDPEMAEAVLTLDILTVQ